MKLEYLSFDFKLKFKTNVYSDIYPAFILRSVMGKELKKFACILKTKKCETCPLKFQCAYSYIFETPIEKNNELLAGRNKASHPFILNSDMDVNMKFDKLQFNLTLFGKGTDYFPYIYYAFLKAGENGIFKRRYLYEIAEVSSNGTIVNDGKSDYLEIPEKSLWRLNDSLEKVETNKITLKFLTPLRMKIQGKYNSNIIYSDILHSAARRIMLFCGLYGERSDVNILEKIKKLSEKREFVGFNWKEYPRYSARQETKMILGGVVGQMKLEGEFTELELSILKFIEIFGLGKNTAFGFGNIKIE